MRITYNGEVLIYTCNSCKRTQKRISTLFMSPGICICDSNEGFTIESVQEHRIKKLKRILNGC